MTTTPRPLTVLPSNGRPSPDAEHDGIDLTLAALHGDAAYHRAAALELRVAALEAALEAALGNTQTRTRPHPWATVRQAAGTALTAARRAVADWLIQLAGRLQP